MNIETRYTTACIGHLECVNPDTLNKFQKQIHYTKIHLPLIDLFIQDEAAYFQEEDFSKKGVLRNNAEILKKPIVNYLKSSLENKTYQAWGAIYLTEKVNIKELLISIEELYNAHLINFDKNKQILEWIDQAEGLPAGQKIKENLGLLRKNLQRPKEFQIEINKIKALI